MCAAKFQKTKRYSMNKHSKPICSRRTPKNIAIVADDFVKGTQSDTPGILQLPS
jgi:hypothetical protein